MLQNAYRSRFGHYAEIDLVYRSLTEQQYWYNRLGYPRAARPGTSNHGYGITLDFREGGSSERHHFNFVG